MLTDVAQNHVSMLCVTCICMQAVHAVVQAAVGDADAAVAAGHSFAAIQVDVGLDPKALLEAWNAIQKQHPTLPVIMFSLDQGALPSPSEEKDKTTPVGVHS